MPDIFGGPSASTVLRWATFVVVEANVAFMYVYDGVRELPSNAGTSNQYATIFAPAPYVDVIHWIIGAAFLIFYVAALWPRRRRTRIYDPFVVPLAIASTLASAWVVAFRYDQIELAIALTAAGVVVGDVMFVRAVASPAPHPRWLRVPFALYFGWMTLALLAGTAQWFNARGWLTTMETVTEMSLVLFAIAAVVGSVVALSYREFVYPTVIAWAMGGIYVAQRMSDPAIAAAALNVCIGLLVVAGLAAVAAVIEPVRREAGPSASHGRERRLRAQQAAHVGLTKLGRGIRWPKFRARSRPVLDQRHRRYLVDLDAVTTQQG
jgi:hypothetical protein